MLRYTWLIGDRKKSVYAKGEAGFATDCTSSFTTANFLLDLLAQPDILKDVKDEVFRIYRQYNWTMTKTAVDELQFTDHVRRESLRLSGPIVRLMRQVRAEVGAELTGAPLQSTNIGVEMHNMQYPS